MKDLSIKEINDYFKDVINEIGEGNAGQYIDNDLDRCIKSDDGKSVFKIKDLKNLKNLLKVIIYNAGFYSNGKLLNDLVKNFDGSSKEDVDSLFEIYDNYLKLNDEKNVNLSEYISSYNENEIKFLDTLDEYHEKFNIEDESLNKEYKDKYYNIQKKVFDSFLTNHVKDVDKYAINGYYRYSDLIENKFNKVGKSILKDYIAEADKRGDVEQFTNLNEFAIQQLAARLDDSKFINHIKSKELRKMLQKGNATNKKIIFGEKVNNACEWVKDSIGVILICSIAAVGILGIGHHLTALATRSIANTKNQVQIETNVETGAGFAKFTGNAILATQQDGKYYVEVFGIGVKDAGSKPEFCSVTYEIEKDLYDKIYKYYDIEYEYGKDGQLVGAKNEKRNTIEAFGGAKSLRAEWDVKEILADEITKKAPVSVTWQKSDSASATIEYEPEM